MGATDGPVDRAYAAWDDLARALDLCGTEVGIGPIRERLLDEGRASLVCMLRPASDATKVDAPTMTVTIKPRHPRLIDQQRLANSCKFEAKR